MSLRKLLVRSAAMNLKSNVKVYFAGCDNEKVAVSALKTVGVNYRLFSCYQFIKSKDSNSCMKNSNIIEDQVGFNHVIMDSGLFTMMFGAGRGKKWNSEDVREWMHRICAFAEQNDIDASFVECDCQKIISPEFAWELRREMKELLPGREIINVFHLEDGPEGFKRLVDYSDYIAISVPELRRAQRGGRYKETACALAQMAKKQKPEIKIHLLGCTEIELLARNSFCTSADSSSWTSSVTYGTILGWDANAIKGENKKNACGS